MQKITTRALAIGDKAIVTSFSDTEISVQGLWAFVATSIVKPQRLSNRGMLTLKDGKILGGHGHRAYAGTYKTHGRVIEARLDTWLWNPLSNDASLFGVGGDTCDVYEWTGNIDQAFMSGTLISSFAPGTQLTAALMKICDVDGAY